MLWFFFPKINGCVEDLAVSYAFFYYYCDSQKMEKKVRKINFMEGVLASQLGITFD